MIDNVVCMVKVDPLKNLIKYQKVNHRLVFLDLMGYFLKDILNDCFVLSSKNKECRNYRGSKMSSFAFNVSLYISQFRQVFSFVF